MLFINNKTLTSVFCLVFCLTIICHESSSQNLNSYPLNQEYNAVYFNPAIIGLEENISIFTLFNFEDLNSFFGQGSSQHVQFTYPVEKWSSGFGLKFCNSFSYAMNAFHIIGLPYAYKFGFKKSVLSVGFEPFYMKTLDGINYCCGEPIMHQTFGSRFGIFYKYSKFFIGLSSVNIFSEINNEESGYDYLEYYQNYNNEYAINIGYKFNLGKRFKLLTAINYSRHYKISPDKAEILVKFYIADLVSVGVNFYDFQRLVPMADIKLFKKLNLGYYYGPSNYFFWHDYHSIYLKYTFTNKERFKLDI
ncbi:MAG: type IX secretion system membrane protein PorP/SprF [Bacteroidales bacterium]|nr:type IX secretion system membrane protein PorP/SprF [Bacteroidales bacterium]